MQFLIWRSTNGTIGIADDGEEFICGKTIKFGDVVTVAAVINAVDRESAIALFEKQNPRIQINVITLHQPWASLIALGFKTNETRGYPLKYRGPLAIHAAQTKPDRKKREAYARIQDVAAALGRSVPPPIDDLPLGKIVCISTLIDCKQMDFSLISAQPLIEQVAGDWALDRYAWELKNVVALPDPFAHKGQQGLHRLSAAEMAEVDRQLRKS